MNDASLSADFLVKKFQFTNKNYRDVYPALESSIAESQAGKTVIITGASQGIGKVRQFNLHSVPAGSANAKPTSRLSR